MERGGSEECGNDSPRPHPGDGQGRQRSAGVSANELVSRLEGRPNAAGVTRNHDFADLMVEFGSFKFHSTVI